MPQTGSERSVLDENITGWIVFSEALGHDAELFGVDYTAYADRDLSA